MQYVYTAVLAGRPLAPLSTRATKHLDASSTCTYYATASEHGNSFEPLNLMKKHLQYSDIMFETATGNSDVPVNKAELRAELALHRRCLSVANECARLEQMYSGSSASSPSV